MNPIEIRVPTGSSFRMEGCQIKGPFTLMVQQPDGSWRVIQSETAGLPLAPGPGGEPREPVGPTALWDTPEIREELERIWRESSREMMDEFIKREQERTMQLQCREEVLRILTQQTERTERMETALEDFRDHGTRHDLNPTLVGIGIPGGGLESPGGRGWSAYLKRMDRSVRMRAAKALEE